MYFDSALPSSLRLFQELRECLVIGFYAVAGITCRELTNCADTMGGVAKPLARVRVACSAWPPTPEIEVVSLHFSAARRMFKT
jgi:hypothetical protein